MPNWCATTMRVVGDETELKNFLDGIAKADNGEYQILRTYLPRPEGLEGTTRGWFSDPEKQAEQVLHDAENLLKYGVTDWYEWSVQNWGTKWGDCDSRLFFYTTNEAVFQLESAWSPITVGMQTVSKKFPNLYFILSHVEEAGFYLCSEAIHDGEVLCESGCEPCKEYDGNDSSEDSDSYWDNYEGYISSSFDTHLKNVLDILVKSGHTLPITVTESE